ncbi:MAG: MBOAT family O-acyltransferase [Prevotella sp.]
MLLLLCVVIVLFFVLAQRVGACIGSGRRQLSRILTTSACVIGVALLGYFKYADFFVAQISLALSFVGFDIHHSTIRLIAPVGISFFTFKLISYVVDVYRGKMEPVEDFIMFSAWVSFFPTIMSGPIDRAVDTTPQFGRARSWDSSSVSSGMRRILWGMFLKMCIADKLSPYTDAVFNNFYHHSGITIVVAACMYSFQIYADFAGYSEMAIGVAQILGIKVPENFLRPYFASNMGDFWRRWHMSLMSWLKDYVYIPLGGSRCSEKKTLRNTAMTFLVSGLWHGANWTFIIWGGYHGCLVYLTKLMRKTVLVKKRLLAPWVKQVLCFVLVFFFSAIGWTVFRADSMSQFFLIVSRVTVPGGLFFSWALVAILPICIMLFKELKDENGWDIHFLHSDNWFVQAISIGLLIVFIIYTGDLEGAKFIYFQF